MNTTVPTRLPIIVMLIVAITLRRFFPNVEIFDGATRSTSLLLTSFIIFKTPTTASYWRPFVWTMAMITAIQC